MSNRSSAVTSSSARRKPSKPRIQARAPRVRSVAAPVIQRKSEKEKQVGLKISRQILLGLYAVIPVSILVAAIDLLFFKGGLKAVLPHSPDFLFLFAVFFNLPHIVGSSVTLFDAEYLKFYWRKIAVPVLLSFLCLVVFPSATQNPVFMGALYLWTVIHVIGQQFGMVRLMSRGPGKYLKAWKWSGIALGAMIYFGTFVMPREIGQTAEWIRGTTLIGSTALLIPFLYLFWKVYGETQPGIGRHYVLANAAMLLSILGLFALGYPFFVILIPRVIHDVSAFIFYIAHDRNRNRVKTPNLIYRGFRAFRIPMAVLSPGVAILLAYPLTQAYHGGDLWAYRLAVVVTIFHYYTDHFMWKTGSPHRSSILFS